MESELDSELKLLAELWVDSEELLSELTELAELWVDSELELSDEREDTLYCSLDEELEESTELEELESTELLEELTGQIPSSNNGAGDAPVPTLQSKLEGEIQGEVISVW